MIDWNLVWSIVIALCICQGIKLIFGGILASIGLGIGKLLKDDED